MPNKCPFCGSEQVMVKSPYIELGDRVGEYTPVMKYCCQASRKNAKYVTKHFDPSRGENPTMEEVARW